MSKHINYEWVLETREMIDDTDEFDIVEVEHRDTYSEILALASKFYEPGCFFAIGLVRDNDNNGSRSWAYIEDGELPEMFTDAEGVEVAKVPAKYHKEVSA